MGKSRIKEYLENPAPLKVLENTFREIKKIQVKYEPFITIAEEHAFEHLEKKIRENPEFIGLPFSAKDCLCTKGILTTAGSKILNKYIPTFDATAVERFKEIGCLIGKTAMDEFGFGSFCVNCYYCKPRNPWDRHRVCGGSSGGAACITSLLKQPHIAIAESTGGSISCPASFCGVFGLTPTYGLVSRWGLIDYANSLDKIGLMAKDIFGIAYGLKVIAGYDGRDSTCIKKEKEDYPKYIEEDVSKMKVGVIRNYFEGIDENVEKAVWRGIKKIESYCKEIGEITLPLSEYALPSYYIIAMAEASTNLAKFCGMRYGHEEEINENSGNFNEYFSRIRAQGFGKEAKRRIILGTFYRKAGYRDKYYVKALKVRTLLVKEFKKAFKRFDVIAAPTMPIVAPKYTEIAELSPIECYAMDRLTVAPNLAGIPMLNVPCEKIGNLPVGLHLLADHFKEKNLIALGKFFESPEPEEA